jgi:uncharacterized membrane protein HdeD (DUF308 family)
MTSGWRLLFGVILMAAGLVWIIRRNVSVGIEGRPPSFYVRGRWAVALGVLAITLGLIILAGVSR